MSFHWRRTVPKTLQTKNSSSLYLVTMYSQINGCKKQSNYFEGHRVLRTIAYCDIRRSTAVQTNYTFDVVKLNQFS